MFEHYRSRPANSGANRSGDVERGQTNLSHAPDQFNLESGLHAQAGGAMLNVCRYCFTTSSSRRSGHPRQSTPTSGSELWY